MRIWTGGSTEKRFYLKKIAERNISVVIFYFFLAVLFTFPMFFKVNFLPDSGCRYFERIWILWWAGQAVFTLFQTPYFTDYLYFPTGIDLTFIPLSELNAVLFWFLKLIFNLAGAYNVLILFSLVLSAFGAYKLVLFLTSSRKAAFLGGIIFGYTIYRPLDDLALLSTGWLPFTILFFLKMFDRKRVRYGVLAAVFFFFACLSSWCNLIFLVLFFFLYLVYYTIFDRRWIVNRHILLPLIFFCVTFLILILPFSVSLIRGARAEDGLVEGWEKMSPQTCTLDLAGYPSEMAFQEDGTTGSGHPDGEGPALRKVFVFWTVLFGYTTLLLALAGLLSKGRREYFFWLCAFFFFFILSLGPYPVLFCRVFKALPLPWYFLSELPLFSIVKTPVTFLTMQSLCLAVLAGIGFYRLAGPYSRVFGFLVCFPVILESFSIPINMIPVRTPEYVELIGRDRDAGAILEMPIGPGGERLFWQALHGKKKIMGGLSRKPEGIEENKLRNPFLAVMRQPDLIPATPLSGPDRARYLSAMEEIGLRYLVVHKKSVFGTGAGPEGQDASDTMKGSQVIFNPFRFGCIKSEEAVAPYCFDGMDAAVLERTGSFLEALTGPPVLDDEYTVVFRRE